MTRIPGLGLGAALLLGATLASGEPYRDAVEAAHYCRTPVSWVERSFGDDWTAVCGDPWGEPLQACWHETDADGVRRVYCGSPDRHLCGQYAAWALWACLRGYPTGDPELGCWQAADAALEACGAWRVAQR